MTKQEVQEIVDAAVEKFAVIVNNGFSQAAEDRQAIRNDIRAVHDELGEVKQDHGARLERIEQHQKLKLDSDELHDRRLDRVEKHLELEPLTD